MPIYIALMNLTEQGIKTIKDAPERVGSAAKAMDAMGCKLLDFYVTMGCYDYVAIAEAPDDKTIMTFLLGLGAQGNVRSTSLKAFRKEEFGDMVAKLP